MKIVQTAERISHVEASDNVIFQRSLFAYHEAAKIVNGTLLEIGTGMGYGFEILAPHVDHYIAVDKYTSEIIEKNKDNDHFDFYQHSVPPLSHIKDNSVDFVVTFQVIEHIKNDRLFVKEISRVLKPGGKAIISTPNIKMSLTRNPWHVREYNWQQLEGILKVDFSTIELNGVFGNQKTMDYYEENNKSVEKITRFDVLNMQYWLPRQLLQIPYDILNRINRKKLLKRAGDVMDVNTEDYFLKVADDKCFDLFAIAGK